jgi:tetratricopeptide (TPR) repeat protein
LLVGWLWYLGMLVPVIGIVQISFYAHADRYTYLPQIGLYLLLTWLVADFCARMRHRFLVLGSLSSVILAALIHCAHAQASYWKDSETLWTHTLACTSDNSIAYNNLGAALLRQGKVDEAIAHYQLALQIEPGGADAHYNLGNALLRKGKVDEAIAQFQQALQINPGYADAHNNLGNALYQKGEVGEAIFQFQKALQINPGHVQTLNNLAWILATCSQASLRNGNEAVGLAQRADHLTDDSNPSILATLAAAYAEAGRFPEAVETAQRALQMAGTQSNNGQADVIRSQLKLYQAGIPFRDTEH